MDVKRAAIQVLRQAGTALHTKEIIEGIISPLKNHYLAKVVTH